ncbi:hypothetical protein GCM10007877_37050 [Marinibactrum halimedae]|uniref:Histidine phosphatase family protein n=2 Tax=Marinibactrum halimedae TaxID=1444977 RepID=A0AA37TCS3_9GAMM|nr:hypothetical protein GCM10007877_37050 [Marinibactrum halimedae]
MRHAKSSWKSSELEDRYRPLSARGIKDIPVMCKRLQKHVDQQPNSVDKILSSPAVRASQLAESVVKSLGAPLEYGEDLYVFDANGLDKMVSALPDTLKSVVLIGHNPAITDWVNRVCENALIFNVPTAGFVSLGFGALTWRSVGFWEGALYKSELQEREQLAEHKKGVLLEFSYPKLSHQCAEGQKSKRKSVE